MLFFSDKLLVPGKSPLRDSQIILVLTFLHLALFGFGIVSVVNKMLILTLRVCVKCQPITVLHTIYDTLNENSQVFYVESELDRIACLTSTCVL